MEKKLKLQYVIVSDFFPTNFMFSIPMQRVRDRYDIKYQRIVAIIKCRRTY